MEKETIVDLLVSILFVGVMFFGAPRFYNFVKRLAVKQVAVELNSTYRFSQALTGKKFDWE